MAGLGWFSSGFCDSFHCCLSGLVELGFALQVFIPRADTEETSVLPPLNSHLEPDLGHLSARGRKLLIHDLLWKKKTMKWEPKHDVFCQIIIFRNLACDCTPELLTWNHLLHF